MPESREQIEQRMRRKFPNADLRWSDDLYTVNPDEGMPHGASGLVVLKSKHGKHNQKGLGMKHKITVVLCVIAIFTAGLLTAQTYKQYQDWRATQNAKAVAASQAEAHQNAVQQTIFNAEVKQLETQCASDKAAYTALTTVQKAKTTAPQCDLNLVQ